MPAKKKPVKAVEKESKKQAAVAMHNHDAPLQEKLKNKDWDPLKEMLEITDEYERGTPKREGGKDYWGACCLESQDVDVAQNPHDHKPADKKKPQTRPIPK